MKGFRHGALLGVLAVTACSGTPHTSVSSRDGGVATRPGDRVDAGSSLDSGSSLDGSAAVALTYRSYVTLGDSVSDQGGSGPFFYDLLAESLKKRFGDLTVVKGARGGALSSELSKQGNALPAELPGPVAISVTIGGNDILSAIENIPAGTDGPARTAFGANLVTAYDELTRVGRFGAGVKVTIFHATIYDPSDGEGNFAEAGCTVSSLSSFPKSSTKAAWNAWNTEAKTRIAKYGAQVRVVDVYGQFFGHGVSKLETGTSWYHSDCIHPNTTGHAELRKMFFGSIVPN